MRSEDSPSCSDDEEAPEPLARRSSTGLSLRLPAETTGSCVADSAHGQKAEVLLQLEVATTPTAATAPTRRTNRNARGPYYVYTVGGV